MSANKVNLALALHELVVAKLKGGELPTFMHEGNAYVVYDGIDIERVSTEHLKIKVMYNEKELWSKEIAVDMMAVGTTLRIRDINGFMDARAV